MAVRIEQSVPPKSKFVEVIYSDNSGQELARYGRRGIYLRDYLFDEKSHLLPWSVIRTMMAEKDRDVEEPPTWSA